MSGDSLSDVVIVDVTNVGIQGPPGPLGPVGPAGPTGTTGLTPVTATGSTVPRALQDRFADRYSVLDWLTAGQPDSTTDNTAQIQAAITAAAGHATLVIPANANNYVVGKLTIPANSHLIIAAGATLFLKAGTNNNMFGIASGASNVLIELCGTLNGNAAAQTSGFSYGITVVVPLGVCNNISIQGYRQGVVTNFKNSAIHLTSCTNSEMRGVIMTNCTNSCGFTGLTRTVATVASGTYTSATGAVSVTTVAAHGIPVGGEFTIMSTTGTGPAINLIGSFFATAGTSGTTLNYTTGTGLGTITLTGGTIGTCTKSYDVAVVDCTVQNIGDLGICFYGGVERGRIVGCDVSGCAASGPSLLSDTPQPANNADCEIASNIIHDNPSVGIFIGSNIGGVSPRNIRVHSNHCTNNNGGIWVGACDGVDVFGNRLYKNNLSAAVTGGAHGEIAIDAPSRRVNVWGNSIRDPQQGSTTGYGIALGNARFCRISGNFIGDYQTTQTMQACIGGSLAQMGLVDGNYYGPRIGAVADVATYLSGSIQGISYDMVATAIVGGQLENAAYGLTAAGTTQANAFALAASLNVFTTVAAGTGCILFRTPPVGTIQVVNRGANALLVYPPSAAEIETAGANVAYSLAAGVDKTFVQVSNGQWYAVT